jgi:TolA-binding protein
VKSDGRDGGSEWPELDGAADIDATLSVAHQVRLDFDHVGAVRAGDEALIARAVDRVLVGRTPTARRRADRRVAAVLGLGVALFTSVAAAVWVVRSTVRSADAPGDEPLPARASRSNHGAGWRGAAPGVAVPPQTASAPVVAPDPTPLPPAPVALPEPAPALSPALSHAPVGSAPAAASAPARGARVALAPAADRALALAPTPTPTQPPPVERAAELFRRANEARRAGDVGAARALYREVGERFPGSAEAGLARVSLGRLLLGAGDARAAEAEFARYLAGGGPLVQEALVGQAQCLQRLARPDEERRLWQRLVDEFPAGVYESQARSRLAELGAVDSMPAP